MSERKIALVTGASRGIGSAIAMRLAKDGFDIWLNYKSNRELADQIGEKVEDTGVKCRLLPFDVSNPHEVQNALDPLLEKDTPYALVNNAGITRDTIMALMSPDDWKDVLAVGLNGFFYVTKNIVKGMVHKRRGRIVNIVSTSGQSGMASQVNYSAAKAGLIGATKALASEVGKRNILVNAVAPGFIETEMTKDVRRDKVLPMIPLQRLGTSEEVAEVVGFLCSHQASYITGQVISVNGGIYM